MQLYFARRTRATRPRWLLEELGVAYEKINLDLANGDHKAPAYRDIHPLGAVPALVDGDVKMFESAAICLYLADKFIDRGLAPPHGSAERAAYYQWVVFAAATLEPCVAKHWAQTQYLPLEKRSADELAAAKDSFDAAARPLTTALADTGYLVGGHFSAADIIVGSVLLWAGATGLLAGHPALDAYATALRARSAWARAQA